MKPKTTPTHKHVTQFVTSFLHFTSLFPLQSFSSLVVSSTKAEEKKRMEQTEFVSAVVKRVWAFKGATKRASFTACPPPPRSMAAASKALSRSTFSMALSRFVRNFFC